MAHAKETTADRSLPEVGLLLMWRAAGGHIDLFMAPAALGQNRPRTARRIAARN
jgi:hypothetical protein